MEIIDPIKNVSPLFHVVVDMEKTNFKFRKFRILPGLENFSGDPRWLAKASGVSVETALEWVDILVAAGVWKKSGDTYKLLIKNFYYDMGLSDHLAIAASIQSRLTNDGPCWYESRTLTTSESLYRKFLNDMDSLIKDFVHKSLEGSGDKVVSFDLNVIRENDLVSASKGEA